MQPSPIPTKYQVPATHFRKTNILECRTRVFGDTCIVSCRTASPAIFLRYLGTFDDSVISYATIVDGFIIVGGWEAFFALRETHQNGRCTTLSPTPSSSVRPTSSGLSSMVVQTFVGALSNPMQVSRFVLTGMCIFAPPGVPATVICT